MDKFINLLILTKHILLSTILLKDDHTVDYGNAIRGRVHGHVCLHSLTDIPPNSCSLYLSKAILDIFHLHFHHSTFSAKGLHALFVLHHQEGKFGLDGLPEDAVIITLPVQPGRVGCCRLGQ